MQLRLEQSMQGKIKVYQSESARQDQDLPPELLALSSQPLSTPDFSSLPKGRILFINKLTFLFEGQPSGGVKNV